MINNFDELNKAELLDLAKQFGTDVKSSISRADLLVRLEEDGVDVALYNSYLQKEEEYDPVAEGLHPLQEGESLDGPEETEVEEEDIPVLVKMTRHNGTYQVRGYTFKRDHPFALVKEEDADFLIEQEGGFVMASPREAREYYS